MLTRGQSERATQRWRVHETLYLTEYNSIEYFRHSDRKGSMVEPLAGCPMIESTRHILTQLLSEPEKEGLFHSTTRRQRIL